jgi:ribosomal protein L27
MLGTGLGSGTTSSGVGINNAGTLSASGLLKVTGNATGNNGIYSTGSFTSTAGDVEINATTTNIGASSAVALNVQNGTITANQNVRLSGTINSLANSNAAVYLTNVTAKATNGTLSVDADTAGVTTYSTILGVNSKLITSNKAITVSTDSLALDTSASPAIPATINAGTGTVTIQNKRAGVLIDVGGSDVGAALATGRTLGINNKELNQITAGDVVIGQKGTTTTSGNLTVSSAITTNTTTGNVTLNTDGKIDINANLTVGDTTRKNLTLNATGNVNTASAARATADAIRVSTSGSVGTSYTSRFQTAANSLAIESVGDQLINELDGTRFAGVSTAVSYTHLRAHETG